MREYEQNLHINDDAFLSMREDADIVLQKLLQNMVEKCASEGSLTIKIDIALTQEYIPNYDPRANGESRVVTKPKFTHNISSLMQVKDGKKGGVNYDGMELVRDPDTKEYVLKPIANTEQRSIFDDDYNVVNDPDGGAGGIATSSDGDFMNVPLIEGEVADESALPGPVEDTFNEDDGYEYEDPEDEE